MPPFGPIKRKDLIRYLKQFGFEGPYSGGKHQFMVRGDIVIRVPNPHPGIPTRATTAQSLVSGQGQRLAGFRVEPASSWQVPTR
jgi:predicted RNA binding protein YcfA (HicA-like mRNA interferase family)